MIVDCVIVYLVEVYLCVLVVVDVVVVFMVNCDCVVGFVFYIG